MNRIEVQLAKDTQVLEFDAPVKAVRIPNQLDTLKRIYPIICVAFGVLLGKFIFDNSGEAYNPVTHRTISLPAVADMQAHGLIWCHEDSRWEKKQGSPNFPVLDTER